MKTTAFANHLYRKQFFAAFLTIFLLALGGQIITVSAQCTTKISTFPYNESFETSNGNWQHGGTSSDWAWGSPNKQVIGFAGGGQKCWIVGGLTGNKYNDGEASWLQSPCFDFTNLADPFISFKVFWEIERRFDGAGFQYSIDNGISWQNVGATNEAPNCNNTNWFNYTPVTYLAGLSSVRDGWSGNMQSTSGSCQGGNGSNGWVTATHLMTNLAGKPAVIFRFIFGAGTTCNSYDGFAIDDILIGNTPAVTADFSYQCTGNKSVKFTNTSFPCRTINNWDFGDPASGSNNISTDENPSHIFSSPGTYTVKANFNWIFPTVYLTVTKTITILQTSASVTTPILCNGDSNGSVTATASGGTSPFTFSWNTNPIQATQTANNLPAGSYIVTASSAGACSATDTITITDPSPLHHNVISILPAKCGLNNGSATIVATGGTPLYTYSWSPSGGNAATATALLPGNYILTVRDSHQCIDTVNIFIENTAGFPLSISKKDVSCFGKNDGTATAWPLTNSGNYTYSWSPSGGTNATAAGLSPGFYTVTVTNSVGCKNTDTVTIKQPAALQTQVGAIPTTCGNTNGKAAITVSGGTVPYQYNWSSPGGNTSTINNLSAGNYYVAITDSNLCTKTDSVLIVPSSGPVISALQHTDILCWGNKNGTADAQATGGTAPYSYLWQQGAQSWNSASIAFLGGGLHTLKVTDASGCSDTASVFIYEPAILSGKYRLSNAVCDRPIDSAIVMPVGGVPPYTFLWSTGSTRSYINNVVPAFYNFTIKDANGCKYTAGFFVNAATKPTPFLGNDTTLCPGERMLLHAGNYAQYLWQNGSVKDTFGVSASGVYWVQVRDTLGCTGTDSIRVEFNCQDIVFPSAFTPNADGRNDTFGPLGTLAAVHNYSLQVFNRFGQMIFASSDPFKKWNGKVNGSDADSGAYIWVASYSFNRLPVRMQKGTVVLIR